MVGIALFYMFFHHRGFHGLSRSNAPPESVPPTHGDAEAFIPIDPVSHQRLPTDATISSVYQGWAYYFENRENRDTFEREPGKYLTGWTALGQSLAARPGDATARPRRRDRFAELGSIFIARIPGTYWYICLTPGHAQKGMYGRFIVRPGS